MKGRGFRVKKIGIDPGHGGVDPGAAGRYLKEKDVNLAIALKLRDILARSGFQSVLSRDKDQELVPRNPQNSKSWSAQELRARADKFNRAGVDLALSIHINSHTNSMANYLASFVLKTGFQAEKAARLLQKELLAATGFPDGGIRSANFQILRETKMPAVLVEIGFISHPPTEEWLSLEENLQKAAQALGKGIVAYFDQPLTREISIILDGKRLNLDPAPYLHEGRVFVPIRPLGEALGLSVHWDPEEETVHLWSNRRA
jgi:N-acetylmuramoyl-L-alanine amidase